MRSDDFAVGGYVDVVFGEVDARFEQGDELDERLCLAGCDAAGERSANLARRDAGLVKSLRLDQIANGLRLGEIDAAGEKCALGKFPGSARLAPARSARRTSSSQNDRRAVSRDLHQVFARVGIAAG